MLINFFQRGGILKSDFEAGGLKIISMRSGTIPGMCRFAFYIPGQVRESTGPRRRHNGP